MRALAGFGLVFCAVLATAAIAGDGRYDFEAGTHRVASKKPTSPDSAFDPMLKGLLTVEYERVATPAAASLPDRALDILRRVKAGDFDSLVEEAGRYDHKAPEWKTYTRTWLTEVQATLATVDLPDHLAAGDFATELNSPEPEAGMPAIAKIAIGPVVPKPAGATGEEPDRRIVEFFWLGQVMPAANGPVYPSPSADRPGPGAWHLSDVVEPWSRTPMMRL